MNSTTRNTLKKIRNYFSLFCRLCFVACLGIILAGCLPSGREVAKVLYGVSFGASRDDVITKLVEAFNKQYPNNECPCSYPRPVTEQIIRADMDIISHSRNEHRYFRVYPADLYKKIPAGAFTEPIPVAEASEGNGSVSIFYDSHTNYIGFLSYSSGEDSE